MTILSLARMAGVVFVFCFAAIASSALARNAIASILLFTTLAVFTGAGGSGADPEYGSLVQGVDGNFYGTTSQGGENGGSAGEVFKITPGGTLTTLYSFCSQINSEGTCIDGVNPYGGLVVATNGNFYGTTENGGTGENCIGGCGTVYEITLGGKLTTVHSFEGSDGRVVNGGLVQAPGGNLYGTTRAGGINDDGTVFKITPQGTLTTLHSFDGADGKGPQAALIEASNGNFYGTTPSGGAHNSGTVFEITPGGKLTVLHSFCSEIGPLRRGSRRRRAGPGQQRQLLWDNLHWWGEQLRHGLPDHPSREAKRATQLRWHFNRGRSPLPGAGASHRWKLLRDNRGRRGQPQLWGGPRVRLRNALQNNPRGHADHAAQLHRRTTWSRSPLRRSATSHKRNFLRDDHRPRNGFQPECGAGLFRRNTAHFRQSRRAVDDPRKRPDGRHRRHV